MLLQTAPFPAALTTPLPFPRSVCSPAQLPTAAGVALVRRVPRLEAETLGREDGDLFRHRPALPRLLRVLPDRSQEPSGTVHPQALHQVHLPHSVLSDVFVSAVAGLPAHRQVRLEPARAATNRRRVDDITVGPG